MMKDHVNLLPIGYRRRCLLRQRLRQWSIVWAVVAFALAAIWLERRSSWQVALEQVEDQEQQYDELRAIKIQTARLARQKLVFGKQQALVASLEHSPPPLLPVALISASAARCEGRVAVRHLVYNEETPPQQSVASPAAGGPDKAPSATPAAAPATPLPVGKLTIDGVATDNVAIAEFVLGLRDSGVFERVDLKSAATSATRSGSVTTYQVECGL